MSVRVPEHASDFEFSRRERPVFDVSPLCEPLAPLVPLIFPLDFPLFSVEEFLLSVRPSSSAEVRVVVIHDIKEVEGVRQQEEQEDERDEEIGDEVNGEVEEEITQRAHETWR